MNKGMIIKRSTYWGYMVFCKNCDKKFGIGKIPRKIEKCPGCDDYLIVTNPNGYEIEHELLEDIPKLEQEMIIEEVKNNETRL